MRRTSLLVTVVAACNLYEPSLLTGDPAAAGLTGGGASAGGQSAGTAGTTSATGGTNGGTPGLGLGGNGGTSSGTLGEGGMDAEAGAAGEAVSGSGGSSGGGVGGATAGGKSGGASGATGKGGAGGSAAGNAGHSGAAGNGGATAGSSGNAGSGGLEACTGATGCARLSVPLGAMNDRTHYSFSLGGEVDFNTATVTFRVRKLSGTGGRIWAYVQHGGTPDYNLIYGGSRNFDQLGSGWTTVTWDVGATVPDFPFDKAVIARLGVEIVASGAGPWTSPTVVHLDSIEVSGPSVGPWPFDDASTVSSAASAPAGVFWMSSNAPAELVTGSTLDWLP